MNKAKVKERFLKAIENLIQEDPKKSNHFSLCCDILDNCISKKGILDIGLEDLNKILLSCYEYCMDPDIFNYFFPTGIGSIEELEKGVERFRKKAMFYFGNFKYPLRFITRKEEWDELDPKIPEF